MTTEMTAPSVERIKHALCVSLDPRPPRVGDVRILPYGDSLDALWAGDLG